jgi:hypothetical protein
MFIRGGISPHLVKFAIDEHQAEALKGEENQELWRDPDPTKYLLH